MGERVLRHSRWYAVIAFLIAIVLVIAIGCRIFRASSAAVPVDQTTTFSTEYDKKTGLPCDGNGDKKLDEQDVAILKMYWKGFPEPSIDCNDDGVVHARDLSILLSRWSGVVPGVLAAPETEIDTTAGNYKVGDRFTASVLLSTGAVPIGAGEAVVSYDAKKLAVKNIQTSSGFWTMWMERPRPPYGPKLVFSGGRIGGLTGQNVLVAEIEFVVLQAGDPGLVVAKASRAYQLDSGGGATKFAPFQIALRSGGITPSSDYAYNTEEKKSKLTAIQAPTRQGPRWIVDLSLLAPDDQIVSYFITYEVAEGYSRSVQTDDVYQLRNFLRGSHTMYVDLHDIAGNEQHVKATVVVP